MNLLLVDQHKQTVQTLSDDDSRLVRLVLLLSESARSEIMSLVQEGVADEITRDTAPKDETEEERDYRIRGYLHEKARDAYPVGSNNCADMLLDTGRLMPWTEDDGGLSLISSDEYADDAAAAFLWAYRDYVESNPGATTVEEAYPRRIESETADEEFVSDMSSFINKWGWRFIDRLEAESAAAKPDART
jgi:hypothetical protein